MANDLPARNYADITKLRVTLALRGKRERGAVGAEGDGGGGGGGGGGSEAWKMDVRLTRKRKWEMVTYFVLF